MSLSKKLLAILVTVSVLCINVTSQKSNSTTSSVVPQLVNFSGRTADNNGKPITGTVGMTFAIYKDQAGSSPLWMETQNVQADAKGNYTVQLGANSSQGILLELFASGEARWLGVRINGGEEQPRVLLLSVPYALKAADAQTLGGLPASAFVLAAPAANGPNSSSSTLATNAASPNVGGTGTQNYIPLWTDNSGDLGNSAFYQVGSGSGAKLGINVTNPLLTLDVNGSELVRGLFEMATTGFATPTKAYNSQPLNIESSAFNSTTQKYTLNHFQWQAEATGNNTNSPGATLNLLYGTDPAAPTETGLSLSSKGLFTFASGQTFPGTGTVTGVTAGTDLTGGGSSGQVTLNLDTSKVPQLKTANTFTGNQTINGNLSATGIVTGSSYQIGSNLFAFGSYTNQNVFLGFAGNTTTNNSPNYNTGVGAGALQSNTTGFNNVAVGVQSLLDNTSGNHNTATGAYALMSNVGAADNSAFGYGALFSNTGSHNTAIGNQALYYNIADDNTATGMFALVTNNWGTANTADGSMTLTSNTTGGYNTATGYSALYSNTTGQSNTATGLNTLYYNVSGSSNTASGAAALYSNTADDNTAYGDAALEANTTGFGNTGVGAGALAGNTTGSYLTCIGFGCTSQADSLSNATAIGAFATVGESNALVLGGTGDHAVKVGIGTATPSAILTIARGAGHPVSDSWETYSSRRWKTNIQTLPNALDKVEHLRGVSYNLKDTGKHEIGVIAEEVGAVVPEVVSYEPNGKDASGVDYSRLTALLIEAVKQQQKQIAVEREQIRQLRSSDALLKSKLTDLQRKLHGLQLVSRPISATTTKETIAARTTF